MKRWVRTLTFLATALAAGGAAHAALEELYRGADLVSLAPYLRLGSNVESNPEASLGDAANESVAPPAQPARTPPQLRPGTLAIPPLDDDLKTKLGLLALPIFLVGPDRFSLQWLTQYRTHLRELSAVGYVVNATSSEDWARVRAAGEGLVLLPTDGRTLVEQFRLTQYPALLSRHGIEQ